MGDLISQKPLFDSVGLSGQVADILQQVRDSASTLFSGVQSKLAPTDTNTDITMLFTESLNVFDMAVAVFRGQDVMMPAAPPAVPAAPPTLGQGTTNADGSCNCNVACPAGSFM